MSFRLLVALASVFVLAAATLAVAAGDDHDFSGEVPGAVGKTWVDLLSQIFPDIAEAPRGYASASKVIELRSIGAGDDSWVQCGDKIDFLDRDARSIRLAGRDYIVVTVMLKDDCVGPLALFDASGKLVDAVNVKGDQHVSFAGDYVRSLGPDGALVIASLWHDNSSQSYDISSLVLARPEGLSSIGDVLALGSRICNGKSGELVTEESMVRVTPDGMPFARIDVEVRRGIQKLADDCDTKLGREAKTTFNGYWRWDAKKAAYEPHTKELNILADWNQKHF